MPRSFIDSLAVVPAVAAALSGCGIEEGGVLLEASLDSPEVTVEGGTLATDVTGSFDIVLELGDLASDPTTVKLGAFRLERDGSALVEPLLFDTNPKFPVDVGVGASKRVAATIMSLDQAPELAEVLCEGPVVIAGTVTDTLGDDRAKTLRSGPVTPDCP
jgi:hypothetical protein